MRRNQLEIIDETKSYYIVRKAPGIATETNRMGEQDLVSVLKNMRARAGEEAYIGVVHRLDQPVEGLMVFAKTKEAAAALAKEVRDKGFGKEYFAIVNGIPENPEGDLTDSLLRDGKTNVSQVVAKGTPESKEAKLHYKTLKTMGDKALLLVTLDTGRHHQIRVQLSHMGHPIVGDRKYGEAGQKGYMPLALCSSHLSFKDPDTGEEKDYRILPSGPAFKDWELEDKNL